MIEKILAARHWLAECVGDRLAHGEHVIHCAYLGLVFHEGHGLYAMVAGAASWWSFSTS